MKTWFQMKATADNSAEISIYDEIGAWGVTAKDFITEFKALKADNIVLTVNSPGGSVFDALAMYNTMNKCGKTIKAKVMGVAASAASFLIMAADEIEMPENAFLMIHNPMGLSFGNAEDMRDMADVLDKFGESITNVYVARSGQSEEKVKELLAAETWLSAAEAKELGFCDTVTPNMRIAACFDIDRLPENVQEVFKVSDSAMSPEDSSASSVPFADQVVAKVKGTSVEAYASLFALSCTDMAQVDAAIYEAAEITAICNLTGFANSADKFIRARTPVADVRASLLNALATDDERNLTDGHQPSGSSTETAQAPASVTTASIWAARRN